VSSRIDCQSERGTERVYSGEKEVIFPIEGRRARRGAKVELDILRLGRSSEPSPRVKEPEIGKVQQEKKKKILEQPGRKSKG